MNISIKKFTDRIIKQSEDNQLWLIKNTSKEYLDPNSLYMNIKSEKVRKYLVDNYRYFIDECSDIEEDVYKEKINCIIN